MSFIERGIYSTDWCGISAELSIIMGTPVVQGTHGGMEVRKEGSMDEQHGADGSDAEELLRRALIDPDASVAVAMRVGGLALAEALTIVFHGRADLGTIQTYVAGGGRGAGGLPPGVRRAPPPPPRGRPGPPAPPPPPPPAGRGRPPPPPAGGPPPM